jgi:hypothetical protein
LALLAGLALASAAPARASIVAPFHDGQPVNVNVGFNTRVPLPDLTEEALTAAQKAGREYLYRLGREECAILKATIAKTCRLTNLNVNTQIQQHNNAAQPLLYINGDASFTISLTDDAPGGG